MEEPQTGLTLDQMAVLTWTEKRCQGRGHRQVRAEPGVCPSSQGSAHPPCPPQEGLRHPRGVCVCVLGGGEGEGVMSPTPRLGLS